MPKDVSIKKYINKFQNNLKAQISQFDYCYNYFYSFYKKRKIKDIANKKNLQISCLQLGFYLANFGMMRGSTVLSKKSLGYLIPLIELISRSKRKLWKIDVDSYSDENIHALLKCKESIADGKILEKASETLVTKIMLGVYGNIPAFDTYFRRGFKSLGVNTVDEQSLSNIHKFYDEKKEEIDAIEIFTHDFPKEVATKIKYTKARLIDMYGFQKGLAVQ